MKKLILIPALLSATLALASDYKYEITPVGGYNLAEGNINIENHPILGAELQLNDTGLPLKPELSVLYSNADYDDEISATSDDGYANIYRIALNGVREFDKLGMITPLMKAGFGYETLSNHKFGNTESVFVDGGIGAKMNFTKQLALKLEAVYMAKHNAGRWDSNLAGLVGLNYAFGEKAQAVAPVVAAAVAPVVVDGDDDNDGVPNSKDSCPKTAAHTKVDATGCKLILDTDGDGVIDSLDKCPNTPKGTKVNINGCKLILDSDNDGVLNSKDICPNTPAGQAVNSDGCPATVNLHINFENNSAKINAASQPSVQKYADFLNKHTNYSAKIVGYTDSRGSAAYNKRLSQKRANAVVKDLLSKGVNAKQVNGLGMGEKNPIADNKTAEGRAKNRRIEAVLTRH
jgi:OOP family OmpA-OmpF porin